MVKSRRLNSERCPRFSSFHKYFDFHCTKQNDFTNNVQILFPSSSLLTCSYQFQFLVEVISAAAVCSHEIDNHVQKP